MWCSRTFINKQKLRIELNKDHCCVVDDLHPLTGVGTSNDKLFLKLKSVKALVDKEIG